MSASEYSMDVFRSNAILSEIRRNYPTIATLLNYNRSATVEFLNANGAIRAGKIQHYYKVGHTGYDDGVKVWSDFGWKIQQYVDRLIMEVAPRYREELNRARITLAKHIHKQYLNELPVWPDVGDKNVALIELNITGSYQYGNHHVVWSCVGVITVTDTRPQYNEFRAKFNGSPDIKVALIDYEQILKLENVINKRSIEDVKRFIDSTQKQRANCLTWAQLK